MLRWGSQAVRSGGSLRLRWEAGEEVVAADPNGLAQAVDNLISNAIEHGGGTVTVEARRAGLVLGVFVRGSGSRNAAGSRPRGRAAVARRGHGLRLVCRFPEIHGGSFELCREAAGAVAALRLPLAAESR